MPVLPSFDCCQEGTMGSVKSRYAVRSPGTLEAKIEKCWYSVLVRTGPLKALLLLKEVVSMKLQKQVPWQFACIVGSIRAYRINFEFLEYRHLKVVLRSCLHCSTCSWWPQGQWNAPVLNCAQFRVQLLGEGSWRLLLEKTLSTTRHRRSVCLHHTLDRKHGPVPCPDHQKVCRPRALLKI